MPADKNTYLVQLRNQIADSFNLEELKALAFELNMDWDELQGSRKTNRVQDLITQLARNGRLAELIYLLRKRRPRLVWPKAPSPERQKTDIRKAFPKPPPYQKAWFWGISIILISVIGISITSWFGNQSSDQIENLPERIIASIPPGTPVPTPTHTPEPLPTALPFAPATEGETLIVIASFYLPEGNVDYDIHNEIWRTINARINDDNDPLEGVRVEVEENVRIPSTGRETEQVLATQLLGEQYNASIIIWGQYSGIRTEVKFLNLTEEDFKGADATVSEYSSEQLRPDAFSEFVIDNLANQVLFLSLYSLGQAEFSRSNYDRSIELIEEAIAKVSTIQEMETATIALDTAYHRLGWLYLQNDLTEDAIFAFTQAINLNPDYFVAISNRGSVYGMQGKYDLAIADFNRAILLDQTYYIYHNRGSAYLRSGMYEEAIQDYSQAISLNADFAGSYRNRGRAYFELGNYRQALDDLNTAIAISPEHADTYIYRGNAYLGLSSYEKAIADFQYYLELVPDTSSRETIENRIKELESQVEN